MTDPENVRQGGGFAVKEGDEFDVDVVEWIDPVWEFDNPTVILRPVYLEFETTHTEGAIESLLLDLVCGDAVADLAQEHRRWKVKTLRRDFAQRMAGREFPIKQLEATRVRVQITRDANGLTWKEIA